MFYNEYILILIYVKKPFLDVITEEEYLIYNNIKFV